jgi:hypothetical protein
MSQPEDQPCVIQSVDNSTEIKLTFPTKTIELRHYDSATATGMVFQTTLKALDKDGDPAVWARLQDALKDLRSGAPRTEDAFHLQLLAERGKWPLKTLSRQLLHTARWLFRSRENTNHTYNLPYRESTLLIRLRRSPRRPWPPLRNLSRKPKAIRTWPITSSPRAPPNLLKPAPSAMPPCASAGVWVGMRLCAR